MMDNQCAMCEGTRPADLPGTGSENTEQQSPPAAETATSSSSEDDLSKEVREVEG